MSGSTTDASAELDAFFAAPIGFAVLDHALHYVRVNDAFAAMHGVPAADHAGRAALAVIPELNPDLLERLAAVRDTGLSADFEVAAFSSQRPGGERRWHVTGHPVRRGESITGVAATFVDVTAQRASELALRLAHERLSATLVATDVGIWHWDPERDVTLGDRNLMRLFGIDEGIDQTPLAPFLERVHHEDRERVTASIARVRDEGGVYDEIYRVVHRDGAERWLHARGHAVRNADGQQLAFPGIVVDVTRHFAARQRQRESDELFRALLDSVHDGIVILETIFDADGERAVDYRFIELNPSFARHAGLVDARGRTARELVPALDEFWYEAYGRVALTGVPMEIERHEAATGRWFDVYATRVGDPARRRVAVRFRDITEAREREAALRRRDAELKRLFETNLLGILFWDVEGHVHGANDEFLRIVGYEREDLERGAIDWAKMTPDEHKAQDERAVDELRRTGAHAPVEKEYLRKDGSRVWVLVGSAATEGTRGVGFVLDISRRKQAEAALHALNERLEDADRRKDEFIVMLAHELRNPLAPVRTAVDVLHRLGSRDVDAARARDVIDRQVSHMARLIDDLLQVSHIARGNIELHLVACDLAELTWQAAEDYRASFEAAGLTLVAEKPIRPVWVEGDPVRLMQMIGNLLSNAERFTERGGRVEVQTDFDATDGHAEVRVADTGVGIDPALLSRLFGPFIQADQSLARSKGGLGLGLALTKRLAGLHHGDLRVASEGLGRGATFTLRIPCVSDAHEPAAVAAEREPRSPRRLRVLVVEDNEDAADMLGMLLHFEGHDVKLAYDAEAGLETARDFAPDVVVSDIGLPGELDGYGFARALRAEPRFATAYLIALSGYANDRARRASTDAGFDMHLAKPPDLGTLRRLLVDVARAAV